MFDPEDPMSALGSSYQVPTFSSPTSGAGFVPDEDAEKYHGLPGGHKNNALRLEGEKTIAQQNAMGYWQQALSNTKTEITPSQGIAAAILAAIPALGGALIGRSVGNVKVPNGVYGVKDLQPQGMGAAGMAGAETGNAAAQGFIKSLDKSKEQNPILEKMAAEQSNIGQQAAAQLGSTVNSGLSEVQANERQASSERAADERQGAGFANERSMEALRHQNRISEFDHMYPDGKPAAGSQQLPMEVKNELADPGKKASFDAISMGKGTPTDAANLSPIAMELASKNARSNAYVQSVTNAQDRFNASMDYKVQSTNIPGAEKIPGGRPTDKDADIVREALTNYDVLKKIRIPELKNVFSDPNATTDDQVAAIASAVIDIKNQAKMGANFTGLEAALVSAGLPKIAEASVGSLTQYLRAEFQGQENTAARRPCRRQRFCSY